jgi:hypothetical protein
MARPSNLILYSIILGLNIFSIVYCFLEIPVKFFLFELYFVAMIAATIYFIFLVILEFQVQGNLPENYADLASEANKDFMTTYYSKFLFPIFYAIFFFHICINLLGTNFKFYDNMFFFQFLAIFHMNILLPLFLLFEMYMVQHARAPKYIMDIIILGAIILWRWATAFVLKLIFTTGYSFSFAVMDLGQNLIMLLVAINGYFLYDYRVFKASNPDLNYSVHIE